MKYIPRPFLCSALVTPGTETGRAEEYVGRLHPNPSLAGTPGRTLDELLGTGFAVVGVAPAGDVPPAIRAAARAWGAPLVAVYPQGTGGIETMALAPHVTHLAQVADDRYEPLLRGYAGKWLLVRPDRVIAAAEQAPAFAGALERLRRLLFSEGQLPAPVLKP